MTASRSDAVKVSATYLNNPALPKLIAPYLDNTDILRMISPAWRLALGETTPTTILFSHPACDLHHIKRHPEKPERVQVVLERLKTVFPTLQHRIDTPPASMNQLHGFHTPTHVDAVHKWCAKVERSMAELDTLSNGPTTADLLARRETLNQYTMMDIDGDTSIMRYTRNAALHAAGAACAAVDAVVRGDCSNAFCAVRPPGHHAEPHKAMGFCFFNNVGVAAMHAIQHHRFRRVAIVDFDVHHGNGTETKAKQVPELLYVSTHQAPFFPNTGYTKNNKENIWNYELEALTSSKTFRRVFAEQVEARLHAFQPELILISAGFDGHAADPLANVNLCADDYFWLTLRLKEIAERYCNKKIVSVLEGGYHLRALADSAEAHVRALSSTEATELLEQSMVDMTVISRSPLRITLSHKSKEKLIVLTHPFSMEQLKQHAKSKMNMKKNQRIQTKHGIPIENLIFEQLKNDVVLYIV